MMTVKSALLAGCGGAMAIAVLAGADWLSQENWLLMAPFGASAVLLFALPTSPLAQARNVIGGHVLTCAIGLLMLALAPINPFTLALATGLGIFAMGLSKTTHPPAGANPILVMLLQPSWHFVLTPVLSGALVMVLVARLYFYWLARCEHQTAPCSNEQR